MNAENRRAERIFAVALEIADPTERRAEHEHTRAGDEARRAASEREAPVALVVPTHLPLALAFCETTAVLRRTPPQNKAASLRPRPSD